MNSNNAICAQALLNFAIYDLVSPYFAVEIADRDRAHRYHRKRTKFGPYPFVVSQQIPFFGKIREIKEALCG